MIDTSGRRCGTALWSEDLLGYLESESALRHNEILLDQIQRLLDQCAAAIKNLNAVAVCRGPGSFTGLRVGMATAKGLCWSLEIPLIGIPTLDAVAQSVRKTARRVLALVPARAHEVYWSLYERASEDWDFVSPCAVGNISTLATDISGDVFLCGEGYERHQELLDAAFAEQRLTLPHALPEPLVIGAARLAAARFARGQFEDLMRCEPEYHYTFIKKSAASPSS
jgi:tRNA threonylcarbamoyladenosine biosynthesis protein TsaB